MVMIMLPVRQTEIAMGVVPLKKILYQVQQVYDGHGQ